MVVKQLAMRLKDLKKIYEAFSIRGTFKFYSSALNLLDMNGLTLRSVIQEDHYWYPLNPENVWPPFVHCMMTVHDEIRNSSKYDRILLVEFYEWIARVAIRYSKMKKVGMTTGL